MSLNKFTSSIQPDTWNNITVTVNKTSGDVKFSMNNKVETSTADLSSMKLENSLLVGAENNTIFTNTLTGGVDDVRVYDKAITDNQIEDDIQTFDLLKIKDGVDISAFNQSVSTTTGASISGETITFNGTSTVEIDGTTLNGYDLSQFTFKTFVNPTTNGGVLMRKELEYNGFIEVRLNADNKLELEISDKPVYDVTAALNDSVVTVSGKTTTNAGATPTIYSVAYTTPQSDKSAIYNDISYSVSVPAGNVVLWASGSSTATLTKVLERTSPSTDPSDLNSYGITGVTNNVYVYTVGLTGDINSLMTGSNTEPYAISENRVQVVAGEDFSILEAINAVSESNTLTTDISVSFSGGYDNYWAFALKNSDAIDLSDANTDLKVQLETFIEQYISMGVAGKFYGTDAVVTGTKHHEYNVSVSGTYQFSGDATGSQPDFTVYPGDILTFNLHETVSGHPFYIKTEQGNGTGNQASGVVNNGSVSGVVRWYPTTARTFYYQCGAHNNMYGTITVAQRPPAFVQGATFEYAFDSLTSVTPTALDTEANTYTPVVVALGSDGKYYMTAMKAGSDVLTDDSLICWCPFVDSLEDKSANGYHFITSDGFVDQTNGVVDASFFTEVDGRQCIDFSHTTEGAQPIHNYIWNKAADWSQIATDNSAISFTWWYRGGTNAPYLLFNWGSRGIDPNVDLLAYIHRGQYMALHNNIATSTGTNYPIDTWIHFGYTIELNTNNTLTGKWYEDGVLKLTFTSTDTTGFTVADLYDFILFNGDTISLASPGGPINSVAHPSWTTYYPQHSTGNNTAFADFRVYNKILTESEIGTIMTTQPPVRNTSVSKSLSWTPTVSETPVTRIVVEDVVSQSNVMTIGSGFVASTSPLVDYWAFAVKNSDAVDFSDTNTELTAQIETFIEQYLDFGITNNLFTSYTNSYEHGSGLKVFSLSGATFEYAFDSLTSVTPTTLDTEANTYTPVVVAVGSDGKYYMTSGNGVTIEPVVLQKGLIEFDIENATTSSLPNIGTSSTTDASFSILKTAQSVGSDDKGYYIDFTQYDFNTNADRFIFTASTLPYEFSTNGDFTMMYEAMINHTHNGSYPFLFGGDSDRLQFNVSSSQVVLYVGPALVSIPVISYSPGDHIKFVLSSKSAEKEHKIYWHNITTGDIVESGWISHAHNYEGANSFNMTTSQKIYVFKVYETNSDNLATEVDAFLNGLPELPPSTAVSLSWTPVVTTGGVTHSLINTTLEIVDDAIPNINIPYNIVTTTTVVKHYVALFEANAVTDKTDVELLTTVQSVANVSGTSGALVSDEQLAVGSHDKTINMTFAINASGGATAVNIDTGYVVKVFTMNEGWEVGTPYTSTINMSDLYPELFRHVDAQDVSSYTLSGSNISNINDLAEGTSYTSIDIQNFQIRGHNTFYMSTTNAYMIKELDFTDDDTLSFFIVATSFGELTSTYRHLLSLNQDNAELGIQRSTQNLAPFGFASQKIPTSLDSYIFSTTNSDRHKFIYIYICHKKDLQTFRLYSEFDQTDNTVTNTNHSFRYVGDQVLTIGNGYTGTPWYENGRSWYGCVGEVMCFKNKEFTTTEQDSMFAHLQNKWGSSSPTDSPLLTVQSVTPSVGINVLTKEIPIIVMTVEQRYATEIEHRGSVGDEGFADGYQPTGTITFGSVTYNTSGTLGTVGIDTEGKQYLQMGTNGGIAVPYTTDYTTVAHTFYFVVSAATTSGVINRLILADDDHFNLVVRYGGNWTGMYPFNFNLHGLATHQLSTTFQPLDSYIIVVLKIDYISAGSYDVRLVFTAKPDPAADYVTAEGPNVGADGRVTTTSNYNISTAFNIGTRTGQTGAENFKLYEFGVINRYVDDTEFDGIVESLKEKYYGTQ